MDTRWDLLGAAEQVLEVPEETAAGYLPQLLMRLAWVRRTDLNKAAIVTAMDEITHGREQQGTETVPYDTGLIDQAQDVPEHVPASIASRTLYTVLYRASQTPDAELTHDWIAETTARAVRQYRESDAVNAARGAQPAGHAAEGEGAGR